MSVQVRGSSLLGRIRHEQGRSDTRCGRAELALRILPIDGGAEIGFSTDEPCEDERKIVSETVAGPIGP